MNNRNNLPQSIVIDRKTRKVGSDDLGAAALVCKWAENEGLRGTDLDVCTSIATALEAAVNLALKGEHRDAAKKAASVQYVLKRNERVGKLAIQCRDGRRRKIGQVAEWFAGVHFRAADEIAAAQEDELQAAQEAEAAAAAKKAAAEAAKVKAA